MFADCFDAPFGLGHSNQLSSTLLTLLVNNLALQIKEANLGTCLDNIKVGILLHTDDLYFFWLSELAHFLVIGSSPFSPCF